MRWEDERYVRVYTRDTATWKLLTWEGRAVAALLFRKVDRAGLADLGENPIEGLAALIDMPIEVAEAGLASLLARKVVMLIGGTTLLIPNFLAAQEAHTSDAQRKRDQRERAAAQQVLAEASRSVTLGHAAGQNVTDGHTQSQVVTPSLSDPSLSNKSFAPAAPAPALLTVQESGKAKPKRQRKPKVEDPPPFKLEEGLEALSAAGRFTVTPLGVGPLVNAYKLVRAHPDIALWRLAGDWLAAGGESWRQVIDCRDLQDLPAWIAHAQRWDAAGRGPVGAQGTPARRAGPIAPMPAATEDKLETLPP